MSATPTNKYPSRNTQSLWRKTLEYSADSVEFVPAHCRMFVCGNYFLSNGQRLGRLFLNEFDPSTSTTTELQVIDTPAILDLKWCRPLVDGRHLLGQVSADGTLRVHSLPASFSATFSVSSTSAASAALPASSHTSPSASPVSSLTKFLDSDTALSKRLTQLACSEELDNNIALSLDWNCQIHHQESPQIAVSHSKGDLKVYQLTPSTLELSANWAAHEYEAWITAFDHHHPHTLLSGADDCLLKGWDLRQGTYRPTFTNHSHEAGVCSLHHHPHIPHLLASGSYDEQLRIWDNRKMKEPLQSIGLDGGVWRLKWHPQREYSHLILAAAMHNGFHVVSLSDLQPHRLLPSSNANKCFEFPSCSFENEPIIECDYMEHDSLAYGCDWSHFQNSCNKVNSTNHGNHQDATANGYLNSIEEDSFLIGSCSFYDCSVHLWRWTPQSASTSSTPSIASS